MALVSKTKRIVVSDTTGGGGGGTVQSVNSGTDITVDNTDPDNPIVNFTGTYQDPITVVANYSALPAPNTVIGQFYWCSAAQGTAWLWGSLGGTFYNSGMYYSNGVTWEYMNVPYQATQAEVNTGTNNDKFVTPSTFTNASKWGTKQDTLVSATNIKTINSTTILGSGDLAVQATLVSGTNIKTINGSSLLGSGNLTVSASLVVGTTAITSGTAGRILFEGAGNVLQESANLFYDSTNSWLGLGVSTPKATIDITTTGGMVIRSDYTVTSPFGGCWIGWNTGNTTIYSLTAAGNVGNCAIVPSSTQGSVIMGAAASSTISEKLGVLGNIVISNTTVSAGAAGYLEFNFNSKFGGNLNNIARITGNVESGGGGGFLFQTASSSTGSHSTKATFTRAGQLFIGGTTTPTAFLHLATSTTTIPHINLVAGVAPTTPTNGDIWFDGTNIKMRIGGVTKTFTLV